MISIEQLDKIAGKKVDRSNGKSFTTVMNSQGAKYGLHFPHRIVHVLAQVMHESGNFRYDQEVWGPTAAQKKYDTRTDLGNTPQKDGDGFKNRGRGPLQITGAYNIKRFYMWCKEQGLNPPDFPSNPDLINTNPWEGLGVIWYWEVGNPDGKSLSRYADENNIEMITRRINGGLNGYAERLRLYTRAGLVLLGFGPEEVERYQQTTKNYKGKVDGLDGPNTRTAIHLDLLKSAPKEVEKNAKAAPVVEEVPVAVTPKELAKPLTETKGFWERITQLGGLGGLAGFTWLGDWKVVLAIVAGLVVVTLLGLMFHSRIIAAVKDMREQINA